MEGVSSDIIKVTTNVNGEDFFSNGHTLVDPGWMAVSDSSKDELLSDLHIGDTCAGEYKLNAKETKPPNRYNDKKTFEAYLVLDGTNVKFEFPQKES